MNLATLRYKAYRLTKKLALGPSLGGPLGSGICRTMEEGMSCPDIASRVVARHPVASATLQTYPFPDSFPVCFPREAAFDPKCVWELRDVIVCPQSGLVRIPDGPILQQSAGSLPRLFNGKVSEVLRGTDGRTVDAPVVPFPVGGYYHALVEYLPNVLLARKAVPGAKVLLSPNHHRFVDRLLDFVGIPKEERIVASGPMLAHRLALAPLWVNGGFVPACDLAALRNAILPKLDEGGGGENRIYISRARSQNRPLARESELEEALSAKGFRILYMEELPIAEQFAAVRNASLVVAPHGAGLANLVAARPGLRVVEMLSLNLYNTCYAKLAVQIGCRYDHMDTLPRGTEFAVDVEGVLRHIDQT